MWVSPKLALDALQGREWRLPRVLLVPLVIVAIQLSEVGDNVWLE
jgi:hypothetical protein